MTLITVSVAGITLAVLYKTAYNEQSKRLLEIAQNKASYVSAIARYNLRQHPKDNQIAYNLTIEQVRDAHEKFTGIGKTGDIVLAKIETRKIVYLLTHSHSSNAKPDPVELNSLYSIPMKRALAGQSGVMIGYDYRGVKVLAAYQPVDTFGWGLVAKIDYSELQDPFILAGIHSAILGLALILSGIWLFRRISSPLINSVEQTESQLQTILNTIVDGVISTDSEGTILTFNTSAERIFGYNAAEIVGNNVNELIPDQYRDSHQKHMKSCEKNIEKKIIGLTREVFGKRKDGSTFPLDIALGKATTATQTVFTGIIRDITERKLAEEQLKQYWEKLEEQVAQRTSALERANRKLEQLARIDALTSIANRRVFDETLTQEIRRAKRNKIPLSLIICDIDYFKNYNDTYGHIAGDKCLQKVAKTIQDIFQRAGELVARYGGEEFAIVLPLLEKGAAFEAAENIRLAIWNLKLPHVSSQIAKQLSVSLGVASADGESLYSLDQLINAADNALYKAKNNGRNRVEIYAEQIQNAIVSISSS